MKKIITAIIIVAFVGFIGLGIFLISKDKKDQDLAAANLIKINGAEFEKMIEEKSELNKVG